MEDIESQLYDFLKKGGDWEQMETPVFGVQITRTPATKTHKARLFLEVNPIKSDGRPLKKRGIFIGTSENLNLFIDLLTDDNLRVILKYVENVNSKFEDPKKKRKLLLNKNKG